MKDRDLRILGEALQAAIKEGATPADSPEREKCRSCNRKMATVNESGKCAGCRVGST